MPTSAATASDTTSVSDRSPPESQARTIEVDAEGYRYVVETGEVIGHVDEAEERFRIVTPEGVDWVLSKMTGQEAELRKIEIIRAAQLANLDSMAVEPRNKLAWLRRRFEAEMIAQAERDLAEQGGRSKTAKYPHGQVARRKTAGSAAITDPRAALEYAAEWAPDQIKRSVGIEGVKAAIEAEARQVEDVELRTDTAQFFRAAEPSEKWTIETGIGKDARR